MFSLASGIYQSYFAAPQLNVLILGLESSGKTTLLERIKVTQFSKSPPSRRATLGRSVSAPHVSTTTAASDVATDRPPTMNRSQSVGGDGSRNGDNRSGAQERRVTVATPASSAPAATSTPSKARRFSSFACPAPKRYLQAAAEDDDEEEYEPVNDIAVQESTTAEEEKPEDDDNEESSAGIDDATKTLSTKRSTTMESIDLNDDIVNKDRGGIVVDADAADEPPSLDAIPQHDVLPHKQMLPLHKIRPTRGTNLAKQIPITGCRVNFFDVSGSFQDIWDSYYDDADAVIFCVHPSRMMPMNDGHAEPQDDDDDEKYEKRKQMQQEEQQILETVRNQIDDDVPFLIWIVTPDEEETMRRRTRQSRPFAKMPSVSELLPHYSSNLVQVFGGSNWSGRGVKNAMEWLISTAKQMKSQREPAAPAAIKTLD